MQLSEGDIETILNTLVFDGKAEMSLVADSSSNKSSTGGQKKLFRALVPLMPVTGLMRTPCGVCPVRFCLSADTYKMKNLNEEIKTMRNLRGKPFVVGGGGGGGVGYG